MAAPDVRVRLSAEGLADVVSAFKKVQSEAEKAGKAGSLGARGLQSLSGALSGVASLLPTLTAAAAVAGLTALAKSSLNTADSLGKLSQKTGVSVETLSVFSFAARTADVSQEELGKALQKSVRFFDEYNRGASSAEGAVRRLFGSSQALKGLDQDQQILKTVDALAKLEPGAKRTALAMEIFGKAGANLLPLIDDLGSGGIDELRTKMKALGLEFDESLVAAATRANDALTDLKSLAEGTATQFAAGFAPALAEVGEALVEVTTEDGVSGFRTLGDVAGRVLKLLILSIAAVIAGVVELGGKLGVVGVAWNNLLVNVFTKGPKQALSIFRSEIDGGFDAIDKLIEERAAKLLNALDPTGPVIQRKRKRDTSISQDEENNRRALEARRKLEDATLAVFEAHLEKELALQKAKNALALDAEKQRFDEGRVEIQKYFDDRRAIITRESDAEIALLDQKIAAQQQKLALEAARPLKKGETQDDRAARLLAISKEISELEKQKGLAEIERQRQLAALQAEQLTLERQATQERLQAEAQILDAQGQRFEAARKELEAQIEGLQRLKGETDEAFAGRQRTLFDAGAQRIAFEEIKAQAEQALADIAAQRQEVLNQVQSGLLFQFEGEEKLRKLEQDRLPVLQQIAEAMRAAAVTPEQIAQARDFAEAVNQIAIASDLAAQRTADFKGSLQAAITADVANFLANIGHEAQSVGGAFRQLALSVAQSIQRIIADLLAAILVFQLFNAIKAAAGFFGLGAGGGGAAGAGSSGGGGLLPFSSGGQVRGPGSSTSDSIPIRVSDYEYIVRAAVVRQPGALEFLEEFNRAGLPAVRRRGVHNFAEGGLVADGDLPAGGGRNAALEATLGLDEGLILKRLEATPEFRRVLVRMVQKNTKAFNAALGRP
ncbi:MAG TPA: hypothetical protein VNK82_07235 [Terriglobales bacterium]|nr:hypothetical protein [Terriglobales bacterium]